MSLRKATESRAYLMTRDPRYLERLRVARSEMRQSIDALRKEVETEEGSRIVQAVDEAEQAHDRALEGVLAQSGKVPSEQMGALVEREVRPARERLDSRVDQLTARERSLLEQRRAESTESASAASGSVVVLSARGGGAGRRLRPPARPDALAADRRRGPARAELVRGAAGRGQPAGHRREGAGDRDDRDHDHHHRAARDLTPDRRERAARGHDRRGHRRGGAHRRRGRAAQPGRGRRHPAAGRARREPHARSRAKSQQIGGVLEIINELAEQTNILAINATIEAAGAGESGPPLRRGGGRDPQARRPRRRAPRRTSAPWSTRCARPSTRP